jgi:perosamine synthetase
MFVPIYQPYLKGNEKKYVKQCLDSSWISSKGEFIAAFEQRFAQYIGVPYATSVCNGTAALHLALAALELNPGDEVIVPTLTYVASVNTIIQAGAIPIFVDSLESTWQIDPEAARQKITSKTRAIMAVHLYGHACDMTNLLAICREHHLYLIEDCAEAIGSYYHTQHVGTFGDIAAFSFYGNKTITTGEGGMVTAHNKELHQRCIQLKNQGVSNHLTYWHDVVAYNYRMTNLCAAIGLAQLEQINDILQRKRIIAERYTENLQHLPLHTHTAVENVIHSYWMCSILLDQPQHRNPLREFLEKAQIETRPLFYPVHTMPMYHATKESYPIAESLGSRGINLPSWPGLTDEQIFKVTNQIQEYFSVYG